LESTPSPEGRQGEQNKALQLNRRSLNSHCSLVFDRSLDVWKVHEEDLRDLQELLLSASLPMEHWKDLCRTRDVIVTQDQQVLFYPARGTLLIGERQLPPIGPHIYLPPPLATGVTPLIEQLSEPTAELEESGLVRLVSYTGRRSGKHVFMCDPALNYKYRSARTVLHDGSRGHEEVLDDYRQVNGVVFPFRQVRRNYRGNQTTRTETVLVHSARFNEKIESAEFSLDLPAGTTVQDRIVVTTKHHMVVNYKQFSTLTRKVRDNTSSSSAPSP
jgi:hypothetical protein